MLQQLNYDIVSSEIDSCNGFLTGGRDSDWFTNDNIDYGYLLTYKNWDSDVDAIIKLLTAITIEMHFGNYLLGVIIDEKSLILKLNKIENLHDTHIGTNEVIDAIQQLEYWNLLKQVFESENFTFKNKNDYDMNQYIKETINVEYGVGKKYIESIKNLVDTIELPIVFDSNYDNIGLFNNQYFYFDPCNRYCFKELNYDTDLKQILKSYNIPYVKIY